MSQQPHSSYVLFMHTLELNVKSSVGCNDEVSQRDAYSHPLIQVLSVQTEWRWKTCL